MMFPHVLAFQPNFPALPWGFLLGGESGLKPCHEAMPCPWLSFVAQGGKPQPSQHSNFHMAISLSRRSHRAGMGHLSFLAAAGAVMCRIVFGYLVEFI